MSFNSSSSHQTNHSRAMSSDYQLHTSMSGTRSQSPASEHHSTRSNSLYMGDLDPNWDEAAIRAVWATLGEPNVQIKLIRSSGSPGHNSGYCFVEFPSHTNASNALLKNGLVIPNTGNRILKLNWASFATTPGNEYSVFVGDVAPNVTEAQLFELFISRYASTLNAKIVFDQMTGVSKGYGFVKFGQESEQQRSLLEMQGVFLNGRAIRVSTTSKNRPKFQQVQPPLQQQQHQQHAFAKHSHAPQFNAVQPQSQFIYPVQQQPTLTQYTDPNNTTVFIGGLSSLVTEDELRAFFQPFGSIVYVKIPVGKGCGFVQYVDRLSAETAIAKMQGFPIGNSRIRLSWGRSAKQAAVMQKVYASTMQQRQQQSSHPQQQQQQQHNPLLSSANIPYTRQPTMPTSYGYSGPWNSVNETYQPSSTASFASSQYHLPGEHPTPLIAGSSNLEYASFPSNSSFESNAFSYSPSYSTSISSASTQNMNQGTNPGGYTQSSDPQFLLPGTDNYVRRQSEMIDRLEKGSNGFIFA